MAGFIKRPAGHQYSITLYRIYIWKRVFVKITLRHCQLVCTYAAFYGIARGTSLYTTAYNANNKRLLKYLKPDKDDKIFIKEIYFQSLDGEIKEMKEFPEQVYEKNALVASYI